MRRPTMPDSVITYDKYQTTLPSRSHGSARSSWLNSATKADFSTTCYSVSSPLAMMFPLLPGDDKRQYAATQRFRKIKSFLASAVERRECCLADGVELRCDTRGMLQTPRSHLGGCG